jgi:hypothetical protein
MWAGGEPKSLAQFVGLLTTGRSCASGESSRNSSLYQWTIGTPGSCKVATVPTLRTLTKGFEVCVRVCLMF